MIRKGRFSTLLILFLVSTLFIPTIFADYQPGGGSVPAPIPVENILIAKLGKGLIHDMQYTPDGKRLVVATSIDIWLYDAINFQPLRRLNKHKAPVMCTAFSPDGSTFVSGDNKGIIHFWDTDTLKHKQTLYTGNYVSCIAFSPDGGTLAVSHFGELHTHLWDVNTGIRKNTLKNVGGRQSVAYSLTYRQDGKILASANQDNTISLWDTVTREHKHSLEGHEAAFDRRGIVFSQDGKTLVSGSWDGSIRLWDTDKRVQKQVFAENLPRVRSVTVSPDGSLIAFGCSDGIAQIWNINTGKLWQTLEGHFDKVLALSFSPDMRTIASSSWDGSIRIWDVASGEQKGIITEHYGVFGHVTVSADGKMLATISSRNNIICFWDTSTGALQKTIRIDRYEGLDAIRNITVDPNGKILATAHYDDSIRLWNVNTRKELKTLEKEDGTRLYGIVFSPDGKTLAGGCQDATVRLWDVETGALKNAFVGHEALVGNFVFSQDGSLLASWSQDNTLRLWYADTGKEQKVLKGHSLKVLSAAFSPNGETLAAVNNTRRIYLWDTRTGEQKGVFSGYRSSYLCVVFSPDGKRLAAGNTSGIVEIIDVGSGRVLQRCSEHWDRVREVAFAADGKTLVSLSDDWIVNLWGIIALKRR